MHLLVGQPCHCIENTTSLGVEELGEQFPFSTYQRCVAVHCSETVAVSATRSVRRGQLRVDGAILGPTIVAHSERRITLDA